MKNVGIICGGFSSEYDISLKSAKNIKANFPDGYSVYLIVLSKKGWFFQNDHDELIPFDSINFSFQNNGIEVSIDLAIVYIHGDPGENGKVQSYLEMQGVNYVNSGPLASHLSFDKWFCNQFLKGFGFNVANSIYLTRTVNLNYEEIGLKLGLPLFVKPCDSGSSFGIAKVNHIDELEPAIIKAFEEGRTVIIESFLDGTEVTCGVYRSIEGVRALPLTEIVTENEFFDYEAKYQGLSDEITPARISDKSTSEIQEVAKQIYQLMQLRSIARIDFMLVNDKPYIIEVNTTPGFSNESIVPKMIAASNLSVKEFWQQIMLAEYGSSVQQ